MALAINALLKPPTCACEVCSAPMTHLADLSSIGLHVALRVFRCSGCNKVTSAEIGAPIRLRKEAPPHSMGCGASPRRALLGATKNKG